MKANHARRDNRFRNQSRRTIRSAAISTFGVLGWLVGVPLMAQIGPVGERFETESLQACQLANGDVAVTWFDALAPGQSTWLQVYSPAGQPRGDATLVFEDTDDSPLVSPNLCCAAGGGMVVVWSEPSDTFAVNSLSSRTFDNAGNAVGRVRPLTVEAGLDVPTTVACYGSGALVHWYRETQDPLDPVQYWVRRLDAGGMPVADAFRVDAVRSSFEPSSALAAGADGSFTVAWAGPGEGVITAQGYDAGDAESGPEMAVRSLGGSELFAQLDVAHNAAGTRMFVWQEDDDLTLFPHVLGRAFDPAGAPISDAFSVDGDPTRQYSGAAASVDQDGDFLIAWSRVIDGDLLAQTFSAAGQRLDPMIIPDSASGVGSLAAGLTLTEPRAGRHLFAYIANREVGNQSVPFVRLLIEDLVFADGFESGDAAAWSGSSP